MHFCMYVFILQFLYILRVSKEIVVRNTQNVQKLQNKYIHTKVHLADLFM